MYHRCAPRPQRDKLAALPGATNAIEQEQDMSGTDQPAPSGVTARVAVLPKDPGPLQIEELDLPAPTGHQVLVREFASGICHSQLHQMHNPRRAPMVIGHEATGEVLGIGDAVDHVQPGDRVLLTFQPRDLRETDRMPESAGVDLPDGVRAVSPQIFTWSSHTIADDQFVIPLADDLPTDVTAIVGCAVLTGAGAVLRQHR